MEKKQMQKWVKALRSGKYKQASDVLKKKDDSGKAVGYCCLGVLCEINKVDDEFINENCSIDPVELRDTLGLRDSEGSAFDDEANHTQLRIRVGLKTKRFESLAHANDAGASFKAIAAWIEKNYKSL